MSFAQRFWKDLLDIEDEAVNVPKSPIQLEHQVIYQPQKPAVPEDLDNLILGPSSFDAHNIKFVDEKEKIDFSYKLAEATGQPLANPYKEFAHAERRISFSGEISEIARSLDSLSSSTSCLSLQNEINMAVVSQQPLENNMKKEESTQVDFISGELAKSIIGFAGEKEKEEREKAEKEDKEEEVEREVGEEEESGVESEEFESFVESSGSEESVAAPGLLGDGGTSKIGGLLVEEPLSLETSFVSIHEQNNSSNSPKKSASPKQPYPQDTDLNLLIQLEAINAEISQDPRSFTGSKLIFSPAVESMAKEQVDWDFWGHVLAAESAAHCRGRENRKKFLLKLVQGIPRELHGSIWIILAQARDPQLEREYKELLTMNSQYEKMIMRDLSRTFPTHEFFQSEAMGQELLFNVIKCYSIHDKVVGYCQGVSFIVGVLLLNMPDEQAYCVLVRLMYDYGMRTLFVPGMEGLQQRLFVFDKLLVDHLPKLAEHFRSEGIQSNMYASQWFLTLFAYKFPLDMVFRIFDLIFSEGLDVIYRVAIALLASNEKYLMTLKFEELIDCLKNRIYQLYVEKPSLLTKDVLNTQISQRKLEKLYKAYENQTCAKGNPRLSDHNIIQALRSENISLREEGTRKSEEISSLKMEVQTLKSQLSFEQQQICALQEQIAVLQYSNNSTPSSSAGLQETLLTEQLRTAEEQNDKLTKELFSIEEMLVGKARLELLEERQKSIKMQERLDELEEALVQTKCKYAECETSRLALLLQLESTKRV